MPRKTEVYSWRVAPALKSSLEEVARSERRSVAGLLDEIVAEHLQAGRTRGRPEALQQRRLHERAARFAGRIASGQRGRAEKARELVRARLRRALAR